MNVQDPKTYSDAELTRTAIHFVKLEGFALTQQQTADPGTWDTTIAWIRQNYEAVTNELAQRSNLAKP